MAARCPRLARNQIERKTPPNYYNLFNEFCPHDPPANTQRGAHWRAQTDAVAKAPRVSRSGARTSRATPPMFSAAGMRPRLPIASGRFGPAAPAWSRGGRGHGSQTRRDLQAVLGMSNGIGDTLSQFPPLDAGRQGPAARDRRGVLLRAAQDRRRKASRAGCSSKPAGAA
jgi:hypothetical protein